MRQLEEHIASFLTKTDDSQGSRSDWNDIRLSVDSLVADHSTGVTLEDYVDPALQNEIVALLRKAAAAIASDVDPEIAKRIRGKVGEVMCF